MDETCVWLEKLLGWTDRCGPPRIAYAGRASAGYRNRPQPHIELVYVLDTDVHGLRLGDKVFDYPARHLAIHNVHLGAVTPEIIPMDAWCVMIDVRGEREFRSIEDTPLFCASPLKRHHEFVDAFSRLGSRCARFGTGPLHYLGGDVRYDPTRDGGASSAGAVLVKAAMLELLATALDDIGAGASATGKTTRRPLAVERAVEFISLHYRRPGLTLHDVALAAGLSEDHFGRAFRASTGQTPMRYLRQTRVSQSRYLLEHTSLRVEEIANEVGLDDQFHFSRLFKRDTGVSPTEWRARIERRRTVGGRNKR